jgi:hypothetical protein
MAKKDDLSEFGFEPENELDEFGFEELGEEFTGVPDVESPEAMFEPEGMVDADPADVAEAAAIQFGRGAGLGLTPIVSGLVGAGVEALTPEDEGEKALREIGAERPEGIEKLLQSYRESRDLQKREEERTFEEFPAVSVAAETLGGMASLGPLTSAAAGLEKGGKLARAASKVIPKAEKLDDVGFVGRVGRTMQEGAKAGALAGLGQGEADLTKGEVTETLEEMAATAAGGAAFAGGLRVGGEALSGLASRLPFIKHFRTGKTLGEMGIDLEEEVLDKELKSFSKDFYKEFKDTFAKHGLDKADALEAAEELGLRISIGQTLDDVTQEIVETKTFSSLTNKDMPNFMNFIDDLRGETKPLKKLRSNLLDRIKKETIKSENKIAQASKKMQSKIEKEAAKADADLLNVREMDYKPDERDILVKRGLIEEDVIDPGTGEFPQKELSYAEDVTPFDPSTPTIRREGDKLIGEFEDISTGKKYISSINDIDFDPIDPERVTVKELEGLITQVNEFTGDLTGPAKSRSEKLARKMAQELRDLSNEAFEGTSDVAMANQKLRKSFAALNRAKIRGNLMSKSEVMQRDIIDQFRKLFNQRGPSSKIDKERFFELLTDVDPKFENYAERADLLERALDLSRKEINSVQAKAEIMGSGARLSANVGNIVGKSKYRAKQLAEAPLKKLGNVYQLAKEMTPPKTQQIIEKIETSGQDSYKAFIRPLVEYVKAPERRKTAILYGLYQQSAFRKMLQNIGEGDFGDAAVQQFNMATDVLEYMAEKLGEAAELTFEEEMGPTELFLRKRQRER